MKQLGLKNFFILSLAKKKRVVSLETITRATHYTPLACIVHPVVAIRRQFPRGREGTREVLEVSSILTCLYTPSSEIRSS